MEVDKGCLDLELSSGVRVHVYSNEKSLPFAPGSQIPPFVAMMKSLTSRFR